VQKRKKRDVDEWMDSTSPHSKVASEERESKLEVGNDMVATRESKGQQ